MQIINNDCIVPFDVDGTLILHLSKKELKNYKTIDVRDDVENKLVTVGVHEPMVRLLREELFRGAQVIVWSRGGYHWAKAVLEALQLDKFGIIVMSKPKVYFDDINVENWLKDRVYLKPDTIYKNNK